MKGFFEGYFFLIIHALFLEALAQVSVFVRDENDTVCGGLIGEVCWNWLEIQILIVNEDIRKSGLGTRLLLEAEQIARDN